jgi:DNA polymerase III sliding clamp (beta) subunit (PCNA family)
MTTQTLTKIQFQVTGEQIKTIQAGLKGLNKVKSQFSSFLDYGQFVITDNKLIFQVIDDKNTFIIKLSDNEQNENTSFLFPIDKLKEIKCNKTDLANITFEDGRIILAYNGIIQTMQTMVDSFPALPTVKTEPYITVDANYIQSLYNASLFASSSESRPVLQFILHKDGSHITTDSHRLYKRENVYNIDTLSDGLLVHPSTAKLAYSLLKDSNNITTKEDGRHVSYNTDDITIIGRLGEGTYPSVERIYPQNFNCEFEFDCKQMLDILKQTKKKQILKIELNKSSKILKLTVRTIEDPTPLLESSITVTNVHSSEDVKIGFNPQYFQDALKQMDGNKVKMSITGTLSPFTLTDEQNYHLILPYNMKE